MRGAPNVVCKWRSPVAISDREGFRLPSGIPIRMDALRLLLKSYPYEELADQGGISTAHVVKLVKEEVIVPMGDKTTLEGMRFHESALRIIQRWEDRMQMAAERRRAQMLGMPESIAGIQRLGEELSERGLLKELEDEVAE